jgi:hypothetical protein
LAACDASLLTAHGAPIAPPPTTQPSHARARLEKKKSNAAATAPDLKHAHLYAMGRSTRRPAVAAAAAAAPSSSLDAVLAGSGGDADFGSPAFWDAFFAARGDAAFEWYGDWRQLGPLLRPACAPRKVVGGDGGKDGGKDGKTTTTRPAAALILGCGNSALSAQVHDDPAGTPDVLSIDTCARAIRGQLKLHARARPGCRWRVGDMTATGFEASSFDVLIDKGGLDALHADDSPAAAGVASAAVDEAIRLTALGGTYAVVSLCEPHVLGGLLARLRLGPGWTTTIAVPPPPPDMAGAALQPLVVLAVRNAEKEEEAGKGQSSSSVSPPVRADLPPPAAAARLPNAAQLAGVAAVVAAENAARAGGAGRPPAPAVKDAAVAGDGGGGGDSDPWAALHPGRVAPVAVGPPPPPRPDAEPRFRATVVDGPGPPPAPPTKKPPPPPSAAVFIVPQGREHEWLFAAPAGLEHLRGQVGADRLIAVALGRGHAFPGGLAAIQAEVGPAVAHLAPAPLRGADRAVPILTLGGEAGLGWRKPVTKVESALSGTILVEDVAPPDADAAAAAGIVAFRRLVFAGAAGLVQSEAAVVSGGGEGGGKATKKKSGGGRGGVRAPPTTTAGTPVAGTHLPAAYHTALLAGLAPVGASLAAAPAPLDLLLVGLGGGGLAAHAARTLRALRSVRAIELDPAVVELARSHFGLAAAEAKLGTDRLAVRVDDGVAAVGAASPGSCGAILIDAGGGDGGSGPMSCPPPPFTTPAFVASAAAALDPEAGVLAINCVSRAGEPVEALVAVLKVRFFLRGMGWMDGEEIRQRPLSLSVPKNTNTRHLRPTSRPSTRSTCPTTSTASSSRTGGRCLARPRRCAATRPRRRPWCGPAWARWAAVVPALSPSRARAWTGRRWRTWCWRCGSGE